MSTSPDLEEILAATLIAMPMEQFHGATVRPTLSPPDTAGTT
jgi:hypothetical protein